MAGSEAPGGGARPHILLIGGDGGLSGVPTYLAQLMRAMGDGARFTVLSDRNRGGYDFVTTLGGRHVELGGLQTSLSPRRAMRALRGLAAEIDRAAPDLVWAHARMAVLLLRVLAVWRRLRGRPMPPLAITFHGLPFGPGHRPLTGGLARMIEAGFLRAMPRHHLIFLSDQAEAGFARAMGQGALARHPRHVLENCSDLAPLPWQPHAGPPLVVMTGRAGYQKDHLTAARILAHLPADWRLAICGGGTERPDFRQRILRAAGPGAEARLRFLGPMRDIRPLLQEADLFLITSRYEGMPIAALEAFEAGLPLASTRIPGMAEILATHPMAVDFPPGADPGAVAGRIVALVATARAEGPGAPARIRAAWAGRFGFDHWRGALSGLVDRLLRDQDAPDPPASAGGKGWQGVMK